MVVSRKTESYQPGMMVRHERLGLGKVVDVAGSGIVSIRFDSWGTKHFDPLSEPMAPLTENELREQLEVAVSDWEEVIPWLEQGWDCIEEYTNDLTAREILDDAIDGYCGMPLPRGLAERIERSDARFRAATEESDLCVWHAETPYPHGYSETYDPDRQWYYFRWPPDAPYRFRKHDSTAARNE